jgi:hypothetical protein
VLWVILMDFAMDERTLLCELESGGNDHHR